MTGFGSTLVTDAGDALSNVLDADVGLVMTGRVAPGARVSWLDMRCLRLCFLEEEVPRVAFISLPPARLCVSFPLADDPAPIWNGIRLRRGDLVLHPPGDRFHQRTVGPARWGLMSIAPHDLAAFGRALLDRELKPGVVGLLRLPARRSSGLLRLHVQANRLAAARPRLLARREVRRALEQELVHALVTALAAEAPVCPEAWRRRGEIMVRFEDILARHDRIQPVPVLCAEIGVPARTLREYCAACLGHSPHKYAELRRLNLARSMLLKADPRATSVAQVARSHGFSELGRFAVAYRGLFGEPPSATLLRPRSISAESA
jgi:AraC-like DNA-binding protein